MANNRYPSTPNDFAQLYWQSAKSVTHALPEIYPGELDDATLRLLADNLPTLSWVARGDGYIVWYNRQWHDYCGTTAEQMEGWGWQSVHDPQLLPKVVENWTTSISTGKPFEMAFPSMSEALRTLKGRLRGSADPQQDGPHAANAANAGGNAPC